jgi:hypothetical protein
MHYSDEPISIVEDLDPEAPPKRSARLWEVILGLLLLTAVLGFAGWEWVHQTHLQNEYGAGTDAIARQDWESAETHFQAASGYLDADKQAQQAVDNIATRNEQYDAAVSAEKLGDWPATLMAIQQVTRIESTYKDAARIQQEASGQVYSDALSGTIALRTSANPPGLYYYTQGGWTWLPKSDQRSQVRSQSADGWIVYDIPGDASTPSTQPTQTPPQNGRPGPPSLAGRRLMAMPLGSPDKASELALDPGQYNSFQAVNDGVWALRSGFRNGGNNFSGGFGGQRRLGPGSAAFGATPLPAVGAIYESYTSVLTIGVKLPASASEQNNVATILAFDSGSNRYILADSPQTNVGSSPIFTGTTTLYLGQPGGDLQTLYSQQDRNVSSAQFSPDGTYIIAHAYSIATKAESILLFSPQSNAPPRVLEESIGQLVVTAPGGQQANPRGLVGFNFIGYGLSAAFLQDDPFAGDIVISSYEGQYTDLKVIDPNNPVDALVDLQAPGSNRIPWTIDPGNSQMSLITGQEMAPGGFQALETLWVVALVPGKQSTITALTLPANNFVDSAMLVSYHLSFSAYTRTQNRGETRSVFSFLTSGLGAAGQLDPTMSAQLGSTSGNGFGFFNLGDYSYGPTLFAYLSGTDLHASLYSGAVDIILEPHVSYHYNPALHQMANNQLR